jgi:hypothetical protein
MPLLEAMHAEARLEQGTKHPTGPITTVPPEEKLATHLRTLLELAGCTRPTLFADDAERKPLTFHDLRATGVTWRIMRGDNPFLVQGAAGHKSFSTTEGYIRATNLRGKGVGEPFPPIPAIVLGPAPEGPSNQMAKQEGVSGSAHAWPPADPPVAKTLKNKRIIVTPTGIETTDPTKTASESRQRGSYGPPDPTDRYATGAAHGSESDPVATALRAGLELAIAEGRGVDAASLAGELAARAASRQGPNVIRFARRARGST